jgi:hypothetical protein
MPEYTPTVWENEVPSATPVKYAITDDVAGEVAGSATIEIVTPVTPGTPFNAVNMNHIEQGIKDAQDTANAAVANRTRSFLVVPQWGSTNITLHGGYGVRMNDGESTHLCGRFNVPKDFASDLTITPIIVTGMLTGDVRFSSVVYGGKVGEDYNTHSYLTGEATVTVPSAGIQQSLSPISLAWAEADDLIAIDSSRDGADPLDTVSESVFLIGWMVTYTADS